MNTITFTSAKRQFAKTIKRVCNDHEPIIIKRQKGHSVVLLELDDYESLIETAYLLGSPINAGRLLAAVQQLETGNARRELEAKIGRKVVTNENYLALTESVKKVKRAKD